MGGEGHFAGALKHSVCCHPLKGRGHTLRERKRGRDLTPLKLQNPEGKSPTVEPNSHLRCCYWGAEAGLGGKGLKGAARENQAPAKRAMAWKSAKGGNQMPQREGPEHFPLN